MPTSGTPPAGGGRAPPELVRKKPILAELARRSNEQLAAQAWKKGAEHAQRGINEIIDRLRRIMSPGSYEVRIKAQVKGDPVVQIVDTKSGEVLREIPSAEMRKIAENLDKLRGLFLDQVG